MNAKYMVLVLAAIICVFAIIGTGSLNRVKHTFDEATLQSRAATQQIGMCFDWYGLTLIDTTVQYSHDIIDSKTAITRLEEGHSKNKELLKQYFKTSLHEEEELSQYISNQDHVIDEILYRLYACIKTEDKEKVKEFIPAIYTVTGPMCDAINKIIEIKTEVCIKANNEAIKSIKQAQAFLILLFALFAALCAGIFMPDLD